MAERNQKGPGNFGDPEQHAKAGKMGGEATSESHDSDFYEEIGSEGGKASPTTFDAGSEEARKAGRK